MTERVALVVGASGLVGSNLAGELSALPGWRVLGASRGRPHGDVRYQHLSVDLLDPHACRAALAPHRDITHVFMAVRAKATSHEAMGATNAAIARNVLDALEASPSALQHVHLVQGTRWYVGPLGVERTPSREDDPRQDLANPYYAQHDHVAGRQTGRPWTWSTTRPCNIHGFSLGYPHNAVALVGAYAAISRELGEPLRFPGSETGFALLHNVIDAGILSRAAIWMTTSEAARNQDFNIANGDLFSWQNVWPRVALLFGMNTGPVRPVNLAASMADKQPVWDRISRRHGLAPRSLDQLVSWEYGDHLFNKQRADITSTIKLWQAGFHEVADSEARFIALLQEFRAARVLP